MKNLEKSNHTEIVSKAKKIQEIFQLSEVTINTSSDLYKLLKNTINNYSEKNTYLETFDALKVNRLYDGVSFLNEIQIKKKYLKDLLKGDLDFHARKHSHAKNILFELELAYKISEKFDNVILSEPDIVVNTVDSKIGIACKKVTSIKNLEKQLSKGVKQIKLNGFDFGIIAINIDNLFPQSSILQRSTLNDALDVLHQFNMNFITDNERYFLKYLEESRIIGVIVHSSVIADIPSFSPRFYNLSQTTLWTIKGLAQNLKKEIEKFKVLEKY